MTTGGCRDTDSMKSIMLSFLGGAVSDIVGPERKPSSGLQMFSDQVGTTILLESHRPLRSGPLVFFWRICWFSGLGGPVDILGAS